MWQDRPARRRGGALVGAFRRKPRRGFSSERCQRTVLPFRVAGEEDDAPSVGDGGLHASCLPGQFQWRQVRFYDADDGRLSGDIDSRGEEIAKLAGRHAEGVVAALSFAQRIAEIGAETVVLPDKAFRRRMVARRKGNTCASRT